MEQKTQTKSALDFRILAKTGCGVIKYGNYGFRFASIADRLKGRSKRRYTLNIPGVRMANGKKVPRGNR